MIRRILRRFTSRPATPPRTPPPVVPRPAGTTRARVETPAPDASTDLVLYKFDACPYCRTVMTAVERLGLDIPMRDTRHEPEARREHRERTGRTQVPCLYIDGTPLFESIDIVKWLETHASQIRS